MPFVFSPCKDGSPNCKTEDGEFLHSHYNPQKEAKRFLESQVSNWESNLFFLGGGFLYHPESLLEFPVLPKSVVVWEPEIDLQKFPYLKKKFLN
ncbi:MAG: hypothetical protein H7A24_14760 [Leptospiraceae bacterium]|nr:hypothetical protein [Leptospiraceae bacterium]